MRWFEVEVDGVGESRSVQIAVGNESSELRGIASRHKMIHKMKCCREPTDTLSKEPNITLFDHTRDHHMRPDSTSSFSFSFLFHNEFEEQLIYSLRCLL